MDTQEIKEAERLEILREFNDLQNASLLAVTTTGSTYTATLGGPSSLGVSCVHNGKRYQLRHATNVAYLLEGDSCHQALENAVAVGYCVTQSCLIVLDDGLHVIQRSSTLTTIILTAD